ncbi:MAG: C40 family peptidase [Candidatus Thiodiazotropha sp. (ex Lucinoma borealis)]|nr:C40 family peptidase [Candidatus Thiodiazotropha sp. (ex Lucinoma borealis)]
MLSIQFSNCLHTTNNGYRSLCRLICSELLIIYLVFWLAGCTVNHKQELQAPIDNNNIANTHTPEIEPVQTHLVIQIANDLKGKPYRYGGITPKGFDCSGLVHYAYRKAGIVIPRTTEAQYRLSHLISVDQARPGDLLFFRINSRTFSHVGLYAGEGRFIHASISKKKVSDAYLSEPYWQDKLIAVGRIYRF